jgi:chromosome segregation ATPase
MDFSLFDKAGGKPSSAHASKLRNQSLYVKFDPLVDGPSAAAAQEAGGAGAYNEVQKDELVAQAVAQAEEEASIVQMESEELRKELEAEREQNAQLTAVMEEYSAEITRLMANKATAGDGETAKVAALTVEKEQIQEDLEKTETAFSDLHSKYIKVKEVVENYKKNEGILKAALLTSQHAHQKAEERYDGLRSHAEGKINEANVEIKSVREQFQGQLAALQMKVKASERETASLKRNVEAKEQDNAELTQICDELVKKLETFGLGA